MSPDLILLFAFMACTFALGMFIGWTLWRFDAPKDADESQIDFWRKSFDKSRLEHWDLEQKYNALVAKQEAARKRSKGKAAPA